HYLLDTVLRACNLPLSCDGQQYLTRRAPVVVLEGERVLAPLGNIRYQIESGRQSIAGRQVQHPEILEVIVHVPYGRIEGHMPEQRSQVFRWRRRVLPQYLGKIGVAGHVHARAFSTEGPHADHVSPATMPGDIEAANEKHTPPADGLQPCVRNCQVRSPGQLQTRRFEADDIEDSIAAAAWELREPFAILIVYEGLRPGAAGAAAAFEQSAKLISRGQRTG